MIVELSDAILLVAPFQLRAKAEIGRTLVVGSRMKKQLVVVSSSSWSDFVHCGVVTFRFD